ncbi:MAG: spore maturation protein A [Clostridia bacterium]|nr:spore maturation protein A [Clostridia bacterium]
MLGKVFGVMCIISLVFGAATGNMEAVGGAVFEGAESAVTLTISLCGIMCLWCGVMNVLRDGGAVRVLSRLISPLLKIFFPDAERSGEGKEEISASIGANLLGIGNAATPLALSAIKKLHTYNVKCTGRADTASRDMITLAVLNTASANLLPTTIIALRRAAGSSAPFSVVAPIWICSVSSALLALTITKACGMKKLRQHKSEE